MGSADAAAMRANIGLPAGYVINSQADNYTLVLTDAQKLVQIPDAKTLTIPANGTVAFPLGTWVDVQCANANPASQSTITVSNLGATLNTSGTGAGDCAVRGAQTVRIIKTATDTWWATQVPFVATTTVVQKGNGAGGLTDATAGTDYAAPTSGSTLLKGNGSGGFSDGSGDVTITLAQTNSSITPCADNTYSVPTSITTVKGIITAIS